MTVSLPKQYLCGFILFDDLQLRLRASPIQKYANRKYCHPLHVDKRNWTVGFTFSSKHHELANVAFGAGLHSGRVKVSISSPEGKVLILRIAHASDLLGLNSALKGSKYDSTAQALELCRTEYIPRSAFTKLLDRNTNARRGLYEALSWELAEVVENSRSLLLPKSTMEKFARLILKWCHENDQAGDEVILVQSYLTQEEIAQMICASRETVSRLFGELKRKRIITIADNLILVRDLRALESLACR